MKDRRQLLENAIVWTNNLAVVAAAIGSIIGLLHPWLPDSLRPWHQHGWSIGITLLMVSLLLSFDTDTLHRVGTDRTGGTRYEILRRWTKVRVAAILLQLLAVLGLVLIVGKFLDAIDFIDLQISEDVLRRGTSLVVLMVVATGAYAHHHALRMPIERDRGDARRAGIGLFVALAIVAVLGASYGVATKSSIGVLLPATSDIPVLSLVGAVMLSFTVVMARGLPGLLAAIYDPGRITAGGYTNRRKAIVMPTLIAMTILAGFIFLLVLFSAGIFSVLEGASENRLVLVLLALMAVVLFTGIFFSMRVARQADRPGLYRVDTPKQVQQQLSILAGSAATAVILWIHGAILWSGKSVYGIGSQHWIHFLALGILAALGPFGFYISGRARNVRLMEERFPDFLRDLASSHKGGLTLVSSVQVAARGDYGPLSPEIQKMADQLTWNVGFEEALQRFGDRVRTPLIRRTVLLILEAGRSGGNTTDVLLAAARDAREIKTLERQRRLNMTVYTLVIYVVFFVFLFVIGVLYDRFVPQILAAGAAADESSLEGLAALQLKGVDLEDYRRFYFLAGVVQGVGNGVLAGVMGSGRALLGLRHAFWMVFFTYVTFAFLL